MGEQAGFVCVGLSVCSHVLLCLINRKLFRYKHAHRSLSLKMVPNSPKPFPQALSFCPALISLRPCVTNLLFWVCSELWFGIFLMVQTNFILQQSALYFNNNIVMTGWRQPWKETLSESVFVFEDIRVPWSALETFLIYHTLDSAGMKTSGYFYFQWIFCTSSSKKAAN